MNKNRKSNWEGFFYVSVWFAALALAILGISLILEGCGGPAFQSASDELIPVYVAESGDSRSTWDGYHTGADSNADSGSDSAFATDDLSQLPDSGILDSWTLDGQSPDSAKADSGPETPICYACGSSACVGTSGGPGTGCGCLVDPHTWQPDQSATAICAYAK